MALGRVSFSLFCWLSVGMEPVTSPCVKIMTLSNKMALTGSAVTVPGAYLNSVTLMSAGVCYAVYKLLN